MLATEHTQSLSEFAQNATQTLERLNHTGEAEVITVDGEAKAVLLSPAVYDELVQEVLLSRDVASIQRSMQQIKEGKYKELHECFDEIRQKLLAMKAQQEKGVGK